MAEWASGYVTEVNYTQGYYRELSPLAIRFALHCAGIKAPPAENFSYCELGFGQGISLNFHAAAHAGSRFYGADINPAHVAGAQAMAATSAADLTISDRSFADLLADDSLPAFDYIGLHGVWTWISAENQDSLVDFLRRHLKPGGVLYLSYNCLPGWSQTMALRHLIYQQAEQVGGGERSVVGRFDAALAFTRKLADTGLGYFGSSPAIKDKLDSMDKQSRNYLVHEYMNRDWRLMYFADVAAALAPAKLDFAASASPVEQIDSYRIPAAGLELLNSVSDPIQRQTVRDYLLNQQFRRDLFVRGPLKLSAAEQRRQLEATSFVLLRPLSVLRAATQDATRRSIPEPLREALFAVLGARGAAAKAWPELVEAAKAYSPQLLRQVLMILVSSGDLAVAQDAAAQAAAAPACARLNAAICARAGEGNETPYLCSPVTGGGVSVGALQQMMLAGLATLPTVNAEKLAEIVWQRLSALGQRVVSGGKTCESVEDNLAALQRIAGEFLENEWPLLQALGVTLA